MSTNWYKVNRLISILPLILNDCQIKTPLPRVCKIQSAVQSSQILPAPELKVISDKLNWSKWSTIKLYSQLTQFKRISKSAAGQGKIDLRAQIWVSYAFKRNFDPIFVDLSKRASLMILITLGHNAQLCTMSFCIYSFDCSK